MNKLEKEAFEILTDAELRIQKLFWNSPHNQNENLGNLFGEIAEIKSDFKKKCPRRQVS